eukprot:3314055-Rhodomonas_salina.1
MGAVELSAGIDWQYHAPVLVLRNVYRYAANRSTVHLCQYSASYNGTPQLAAPYARADLVKVICCERSKDREKSDGFDQEEHTATLVIHLHERRA